ncbi:NAD(P)H-dependent glycerol-3-phosphate dehydrogenase [Moheibacter lacus]|uniref:Glycerol-3-phosphate dehydrogenase n=1 Tax=Moheibacter lacus TaxID=2745851 RepID=A0A838ZM52_9FLAO|nr:NAD(P)H-dependent glycerol-3-phosphate dehydrogenase [Moheibacter lacus]MBA5628850.1 NAD(P)H-dependent glycerol-3-phosphate dehydrogenase [Moheibacter lacus]
MSKPKVGLVGGGSWATAIAKMLCKNHETIHWWVRNEYTKEYILKHKHNPNYLTAVAFSPTQLLLTTDINELVENSDWIIMATPSIHLEACLENLTTSIENKLIVSAIKGIVPGHLKIVGEYLHDEFQMNYENFGVISGPCHAEEVALERLSYLTIAAQDKKKAKLVADGLACSFIKTTVSEDIFGTEYAAVLKNIYAIAAGIAHGLGYGDNFQAVLMSNATREMNRITQHISPIKRDVKESAYLGDLLVTGYSNFSRNRMFGNMIGKGYTVKSAILEMNMVAEGYYATQSVYQLKKILEVKAPILAAVYKTLYAGKEPKKVFARLANKLN